MNIPNKLTVLRLCLVPVFFISYMISPYFSLPGTVLMLISYAVAEITDLADGKIARKYNLVTDLGKVMDPFADTLSHLTYFVCFTSRGIMPLWCFVIIMWREFSILFLRMVMMKTGKAMPANIWGKSKTCLYAAASILSIAYIALDAFLAIDSFSSACLMVLYVAFALSALASLLSFITYISSIIKSKALSGLTR